MFAYGSLLTVHCLQFSTLKLIIPILFVLVSTIGTLKSSVLNVTTQQIFNSYFDLFIVFVSKSLNLTLFNMIVESSGGLSDSESEKRAAESEKFELRHDVWTPSLTPSASPLPVRTPSPSIAELPPEIEVVRPRTPVMELPPSHPLEMPYVYNSHPTY